MTLDVRVLDGRKRSRPSNRYRPIIKLCKYIPKKRRNVKGERDGYGSVHRLSQEVTESLPRGVLSFVFFVVQKDLEDRVFTVETPITKSLSNYVVSVGLPTDSTSTDPGVWGTGVQRLRSQTPPWTLERKDCTRVRYDHDSQVPG